MVPTILTMIIFLFSNAQAASRTLKAITKADSQDSSVLKKAIQRVAISGNVGARLAFARGSFKLPEGWSAYRDISGEKEEVKLLWDLPTYLKILSCNKCMTITEGVAEEKTWSRERQAEVVHAEVKPYRWRVYENTSKNGLYFLTGFIEYRDESFTLEARSPIPQGLKLREHFFEVIKSFEINP